MHSMILHLSIVCTSLYFFLVVIGTFDQLPFDRRKIPRKHEYSLLLELNQSIFDPDSAGKRLTGVGRVRVVVRDIVQDMFALSHGARVDGAELVSQDKAH